MIIERIYAEGFLEYARDTIGFARGIKEITDAKEIFRENPELKSFLEDPALVKSEKEETIDRVFSDGFSEDFRNFLKLLLGKGRINIFADIARYVRIKYAHGEEVDAVVSASYPLDTDVLGSIKAGLEKRLGKKLHIYSDLDGDLLGGVRVTIGNMVLDGSVKKRLSDMRDKLIAARVG